MKDNRAIKAKDVDLNDLQFFNSEEFNEFMSNLLNQDSLNPKTREEVLKKIEKVFKFYEQLKEINESNDLLSNKNIAINSLLSANGFADKESLIEFINNELAEISNILNVKSEQMGIYIVDYSSNTDDAIHQRIDELEDSANVKLDKVEEEIELIQNALSENADYIESEIERKTEKLGNEIEGMTKKVSAPTQLAIIKPSFLKILKRILSEREVAKKSYKTAPKSLKKSYPAPKSKVRCFLEAYFEYADEKELSKDASTNNLQSKLAQKSQKTKEIKNYLASLQNKGNLELENVKTETNVALELLPALTKFVNIGNSLALQSNNIENNVNDVLNKKVIPYESLVNKVNTYLPNEFSKTPLKLVVDNTPSKSNEVAQKSTSTDTVVDKAEVSTKLQPEEIINEVSNITNNVENLELNTNEISNKNKSDELINEITNTIDTLTDTTITSDYGLTPSDMPLIGNEVNDIPKGLIDELTNNIAAAVDNLTSSINFEGNEQNKSDELINEISTTIDALDSTAISESNIEAPAASSIDEKDDLEQLSKVHIVQPEVSEDDVNDNTPTEKISDNIDDTANNEEVKTDVLEQSRPVLHSTTPSAISKDELEKTRVKTQQKLQKAQDKFDKITNKAQEQLERAKAKAQLEIKSIKDQALELLKEANATAKSILNDAEQRSLSVIKRADSTSQELINTANKNAQDTVLAAENKAVNLIETAKSKVEKMKVELQETCKNIITTAEQKSNTIIITANRESEDILTNSQNESTDIMNSIDVKIQETKDKIADLKKLIRTSESSITTHKQDIQLTQQRIKKFEELKSAAQQIGLDDDEINDFDSKLQKLFNDMQVFNENIANLENIIKSSGESIVKLNDSLDTIRPTLEEKAKTLLEEAKIKSASILEKSQSESKYIREKAKLDVKELKEKTNNEMREILLNSKEKAKNAKESAKLESARILEEATKKSKILLATAQDESEEIKEKANTEANMILTAKKAELDFILTEEDFKKVC